MILRWVWSKKWSSSLLFRLNTWKMKSSSLKLKIPKCWLINLGLIKIKFLVLQWALLFFSHWIFLKKNFEQTLYRTMIGIILYLTMSPYNISFSICVSSIFQDCSKTSHIAVIKRVIKYVSQTSYLGIYIHETQLLSGKVLWC